MNTLVSSRGRFVAGIGISWLAVGLLACAHSLTAAGRQRYSILTAQQIGMDAGLVALNNHGQVVGRSKSGHVLFYDGEKTIDYGNGGGEEAHPTALNDRGQFTGQILYPDNTRQRFIAGPGETKLLPLGEAGRQAYPAWAINDQGHMTWMEDSFSPQPVAILGIFYHEGISTPLYYGDWSVVYPRAMNRSDQIVGDADLYDTGEMDSFLWQDGKLVFLPTPAGSSSIAQKINDAGSIAGILDLATQRRRTLFLYSEGRLVDLGKIGNFEDSLYDSSRVDGMNNLGVIVGWAARDFIWMGGRMMYLPDWVDMPAMGIIRISAWGINDRGQLLAGVSFDELTGANCVLTPLPPKGEPAHLVNISARAGAGSGDQTCITGFVVSGGSRSILVRTVGPTLQSKGVTGFAADPALKLFAGGELVDTNDNWGAAANAAEVATTMSAVGAFALAPDSKDAALLATVPAGVHSVHAADPSGAAGVVLSEIYDAGSGGDGRLVNCSARMQVGAGDSIGILGFVVAGDGPVTVLLRAIGPGLKAQGVDAVLADPLLWLHDTTKEVMGNDNWGNATNQPLLAATMAQVGAFALPDGSKDAALLVQLMPGAYTMTVTGKDGGQGVALLEVYEVPAAL